MTVYVIFSLAAQLNVTYSAMTEIKICGKSYIVIKTTQQVLIISAMLNHLMNIVEQHKDIDTKTIL